MAAGTAALLLVLGGCGDSTATTTTGDSTTDADSQMLFSFDGDEVTVVGGAEKGFTLTFTGVGDVSAFSDRPVRDASRISTSLLVGDWDEIFGSDPPNVAVAMAAPDGGEDAGVIVVDAIEAPDESTITMTAAELEGDLRVGRFTDPAVFVDGTTYQHYSLTLDVENLSANESPGFTITRGATMSYSQASTGNGDGGGDDGGGLDGGPGGGGYSWYLSREGSTIRSAGADSSSWSVDENGDELSVQGDDVPTPVDVSVSGVDLMSWNGRDHISVDASPGSSTLTLTISRSGGGSTTTVLSPGVQDVPLP